MNYKDKELYCCDCGAIFLFSAGEQEFLNSWGLMREPKRCPSCSRLEKSALKVPHGGFICSHHQMFRVVCADCGKYTEVPFQPRPGKRVYCSDCYQKVRSYR